VCGVCVSGVCECMGVWCMSEWSVWCVWSVCICVCECVCVNVCV